MPFLSTISSHRNQARMLLANKKALQAEQDAKQAQREFWFKIKFSACLLAGVAGGTFLLAVIAL